MNDEALRQACEEWAETYDLDRQRNGKFYEFQIDALMRICRQQQAVGVSDGRLVLDEGWRCLGPCHV